MEKKFIPNFAKNISVPASEKSGSESQNEQSYILAAKERNAAREDLYIAKTKVLEEIQDHKDQILAQFSEQATQNLNRHMIKLTDMSAKGMSKMCKHGHMILTETLSSTGKLQKSAIEKIISNASLQPSIWKIAVPVCLVAVIIGAAGGFLIAKQFPGFL